MYALPPAARAQRHTLLAEHPQQKNGRAHHILGDRVCISSWSVDDLDAAPRALCDIDIVESYPGAQNKFSIGIMLKQSRVDLCVSAHKKRAYFCCPKRGLTFLGDN